MVEEHDKIIAEYIGRLEKLAKTGVAKEHAHRPALAMLLEKSLKDITAVNEPTQIECGAPDILVVRADLPLGHVEAKDLGENLDKMLDSEQLKRYLNGLPNFIFTNYLEFIWFVDGTERDRVSIGETKKAGKAISIKRDPDTYSKLSAMLQEFRDASSLQIKSAEDLAKRLASTAILLRAAVSNRLRLNKKSELHNQLEYFRSILSLNMDKEAFSDIYAQTITYGLFTSRCFHDGSKPFTRELAAYELPKSNPFLRSIFAQVAGPDMDPALTWTVDHLASVLNITDISTVLKEFGIRSGRGDPIFYFYEDFLSHYDPELKEVRGVYYTPEPVVRFIVRSVDELLKSTFEVAAGVADRSFLELDDGSKAHKVIILDPATGTGTFLSSVIDQIYSFEADEGRAGNWPTYVRESLLPRVFGFELLMAPYTICHLKLGLSLTKSGFEFDDDERLGVFLTNSLEEAQSLSEGSPFMKALREEGIRASYVKSEAPVMVVLGNPPYSGHSANSGEFLNKLLRGFDITEGEDTESYFHINGVSIRERQPKWLNDDYVKFIRFSQWKIEKNGCGILAFITNHNYLSAPTFRAMRASLLNTFDEIYILDLHGSAKRRDKAADGSADQNVFDIQQGVAIGIFVKTDDNDHGEEAVVRYSDLRGPRSTPGLKNPRGKYEWLESHSVEKTKWKELEPTAPGFLFVPRDKKIGAEYNAGIALNDLFEASGVGMVGGRDHFNFSFTREEMEQRVYDFVSMEDEEAREFFELGKDSTAWSVKKARHDIERHGDVKERIVPILYRPFDYRYTYYTGKSNGFLARPTDKVNGLMSNGENIAICSSRSVEIASGWSHVLATDSMVQHHVVSTKEVNHLFPLWTCSDVMGAISKHHNLSQKAIGQFVSKLGIEFKEGSSGKSGCFGEEDIFHYVLAVLHSAEYRQRYSEPLRDSYAKIPITSSLKLFKKLCKIGKTLRGTMLLDVGPPKDVKFPAKGDNTVQSDYIELDDENNLWINEDQYFTGIDELTYSFSVGGTNITTKWLEDRDGRALTTDDVVHYMKMLSAIRALADIGEDIDDAIDEEDGWPIE